jgi:hypothetical protein
MSYFYKTGAKVNGAQVPKFGINGRYTINIFLLNRLVKVFLAVFLWISSILWFLGLNLIAVV